jgi:hypothetical protein
MRRRFSSEQEDGAHTNAEAKSIAFLEVVLYLDRYLSKKKIRSEKPDFDSFL